MARKDISDAEPNSSEPSFETALSELEAIVHQLEEGDLGLAESLGKYEQGVRHLKHCYQLLKAAEQKIELLTGIDSSGGAITEPFRDESLTLEEQAGSRRRKRASAADAEDEG
ncbi:MAG TPA: exodeoxyribonuclease VII small subunit [Pirellulaceae bacterium]|nr:exodeoxyribonuclease VII small subunit [Pirellulaceae bacterium]